jgi:hypothetical protein
VELYLQDPIRVYGVGNVTFTFITRKMSVWPYGLAGREMRKLKQCELLTWRTYERKLTVPRAKLMGCYHVKISCTGQPNFTRRLL